MALMFILSDFGQTFATRERAAQLREELMDKAVDHEEVIVDFDGVTNVSYSFADEFLGKLCADTTLRVQPKNLAPRVALIANRAVARRGGCAVAN
jgi:hypothetical protein